ncbi:hypothetical protein B0T22DRAFT_375130 [Podospora appendiculata]|uniref:DUF6594 domain-containing protein n=1 Tax=Podospora appendiculata TaxID=314037 RepID=A0AAE0XCK5_9PEZI|nr:hypothetical protein B0T22DRAFT_375130 [Podospora appendiculata]
MPDKLFFSRSKGETPVVHRTTSTHDPDVLVDGHSEDEVARHSRPRTKSVVFVHGRGNMEHMTSESESSSKSDSTITPPPHDRHGRAGKTVVTTSKAGEIDPSESRRRPNALNFLDKDSPAVTEERIRRALAQASEDWSPRSISSTSTVESSSQRSIAETDATTPEHSINGDKLSPSSTRSLASPPGEKPNDPKYATEVRPSARAQHRLHSQMNAGTAPTHRYGTPEMARGSAKLPHLPPSELQPRVSAPGQGHAKHLPRAERLPLTGYELLAAKISNSNTRPRRHRRGSSEGSRADSEYPNIKPIYRRFEALNHRLLLHLQDELSELEEQLHRLDTADTQTRRLQNCILPASRRAEFMAGGELQWHKTDILGKIGFKLSQYNQALVAFNQTQSLPPASMSDIEDYRTYLATQNPIAEIETRFLDPADDLVCLAPTRSPTSSGASSPSYHLSDADADDALTPMPYKTSFGNQSVYSNSSAASSRKGMFGKGKGRNTKPSTFTLGLARSLENIPMGQAAGLAALGVVVPVVTFPVIVDFVGRMAVVLVVGLGIASLRRRLGEAGMWIGSGQVFRAGEGMIVAGIYGLSMALVAVVV